MPHSQVYSNNPYPEPNQYTYSYDIYFFKIYSNIVLSTTPRFQMIYPVSTSYVVFQNNRVFTACGC